MSNYALMRLRKMQMEQELKDEQERMFFFQAIQEYTGLPCDQGVDLLSDDQIKELLDRVKKRRKRLDIAEAYVREQAYMYARGATYCG